MPRLSSLSLAIVLWLGAGCSSTDPGETGAGGHGGAIAGASGSFAGSGGTTGGAGGAMCGSTGGVGLGGPCRSPTDQRFDCALTYEEQAKVTTCSGLGALLVYAGWCGSGWAWSCRTGVTSFDCIYDATKNLVKALSCAEGQCDVSSDVSTDGGRACDIHDLNRPPTGCADPAADAGGGDCCGDGKLPPSEPPFSCAATYAAQQVAQCTRSGDCGGRSVVAQVGVGYEIRCGYDAQGVLRAAERCDDGERFCGKRCLRSTNLGPDAGNDGLCPSYNLPNACPDGGVRD